MESPYKRKKYRNKNKKSNSTKTQTATHSTNEITKNNKNTKSKKKNDLKGGKTTNIHLTGKEHIEQALSKTSVESNQEDNTKFVILAEKLIDSN